QLAPASSHHGSGPYEVVIDRFHAMDGIHQDGKERSEKYQEDRRLVGDAEPDDGERYPGDRWNGPQHLQRGFEGLLEDTGPADGDAGQDAQCTRQSEAAENPQRAGQSVARPMTGIGLRRLVEAEDPVA